MNQLYVQGLRLNEMPPSDSYLSHLPIIQYLNKVHVLPFSSPITFLVGENGTGKSTLLETIAIGMHMNPEGGSRDTIFSTYDSYSDLYEYTTLLRSAAPKDGFFLRAESFYNTSSYLDENSLYERYGGLSFHQQSHGESFLALAKNRFEGNGLYLLDEPEAALSPQRILSLMCIIQQVLKKHSQFIISTHSPILMTYPHADILQLSETGIAHVSFRETEHYQLTRRFMEDPEHMLKMLLQD